mmetsp:Transcript_28333/g.83206  ORF Transcript_28333/g.83206 Transcript_28333/m.83206 type:complete len:101 (-) Transcript_28333:1909-2211(-)
MGTTMMIRLGENYFELTWRRLASAYEAHAHRHRLTHLLQLESDPWASRGSSAPGDDVQPFTMVVPVGLDTSSGGTPAPAHVPRLAPMLPERTAPPNDAVP